MVMSRLGRLMVKVRIKETIFLLLGVLSASIGLKGLLLPNHFLDGARWEFHFLVKYSRVTTYRF